MGGAAKIVHHLLQIFVRGGGAHAAGHVGAPKEMARITSPW